MTYRAIAVACVLAGCASSADRGGASTEAVKVTEQADETSFAGLREAFPHVWVDVRAKVVEFEAKVSPMLVPDERAPRYYLEVLVCAPDTREHETFLVTDAKPSHIHAALVSIGLKPGRPGSIRQRSRGVEVSDPEGDRLQLRFTYSLKGQEVEADPLYWIVNARKEQPSFVDHERARAATAFDPPPGWVFAGSRFVERGGGEVYDADGAGVVIGLSTFGNEVIAWSRAISPDSVVQAPEWIADFGRTPPAGTAVRVRLRPSPAPSGD